ncbi:MAG: inosine-5-monophosphate dehydrogenase [Cellvibrio sp.]|nr:inosine-5-monophosphate dehydrogenase [Cellvibrio sp.]
MQISKIMTTYAEAITPDQTVSEAATRMADIDSGALFVEEGTRLVGVITDRDIVIKANAKGLTLDTPVKEIMTSELVTCTADEEVREVAERMAEAEVRRIPVIDEHKCLVGVVSLSNIVSANDQFAENTLLDATAKPHK